MAHSALSDANIAETEPGESACDATSGNNDNSGAVNVNGRAADEADEVFTSSKEDLSSETSDTGSVKLNHDELDNPFQAAAQIVKGPVSVSTLVGSTVLLEALVIGRPEPTVRWLKGVSFLAVETVTAVLTLSSERKQIFR